MKLDLRRINARTGPIEFRDWPRIFPARHRKTPVEAGLGLSRFSSPSKLFRVLYAAEDFPTAFAEAVVRDRFAGKQRRYLYRPHLESMVATEISTRDPLLLLDLTGSSAYELGLDTDAKGARTHRTGQRVAEALYKQTVVDGVIFPSRLTGASCVAIFDRGFAKIVGTSSIDLLRVAAVSDEIERLGITIRKRASRSP